MEEYEYYFKPRNFHHKSWSDIMDNEKFYKSNRECEEISDQNVQLLPRKDVSLYGIIPMHEGRWFSSCKDCKLVFNPRDVLLHKDCYLKVKSQPETTQSKRTPRARKIQKQSTALSSSSENVLQFKELNTKESRQNALFIANANELGLLDANATPKASLETQAAGDTPLRSTISHMPQDSTHDKPTINNSSNKSYSKSYPNLHFKPKGKKNSNCLVLDTKGPSTGRIEYSNHSSDSNGFQQQKSSLNLDNNDVNSVVYMQATPQSQPGLGEYKNEESSTRKLQDNSIYEALTIGAPYANPINQCSPQPELTGDFSMQINSLYSDKTSTNEKPMNISFDETSNKSNSNVHINPKKMKLYRKTDSNTHCGLVVNSKGSSTRSIHHSIENHGFAQQNQPLSLDNDYFSQEVGSADSVVSALTPLEILGADETMCLASTQQALTATECSHAIYFTIPDQLSIEMHESRPKLASVPLYGARNIGGAITISKQPLINQREDILNAINSKHKPKDIISS